MTVSYSKEMESDFEKYTGLKKIIVPIYDDGRADFYREFPSAKTTLFKVHYIKKGETAILEFKDDVLIKYGRTVRNFIVETFTYQYRKIYGKERLIVFRKNSLIFETPVERRFSKTKLGTIH